MAYFAWEASVRLAVAAAPPDDCKRLVVPSLGDWVSALDAPKKKLTDPALLEAEGLLTEVGIGQRSAARSTNARRLLGSLPAYRNAAVGHGSVRPLAFYDPAAHTLCEALELLWSMDVFLPPEARLIYLESIELDPDGKRRARLFDLMGQAATLISPRGVTGLPSQLLPRTLCLQLVGSYRSLHPWLVYLESDLQERVLFFNGRRRSARYLDYVSGEELRGKALAEAFSSIEADLVETLQSEVRPAQDDGEADAGDDQDFGDYELVGKLGQGGMGVVYLARQRSLDRAVALKVLPAHVDDNRVAVARFEREVQALARCEHPNVVKILASGVNQGAHYYAMELVLGADLAQVSEALSSRDDFGDAVSTASELTRSDKGELFSSLPKIEASAALVARGGDRIERLVELFRDAALGVHHLHEQGIVHRDIKPANLMVTEHDHRLVVMDLGLASLGDSQSITREGSQILGTLRYMPPEQLQRNTLQLDRRADVYALGATFYELLCGRPMFDGDSEVRLIEQILRQDPLPPRQANDAIGPDLATILDKATHKEAKLRYDTADALADDLAAFLEGRPIAARPPSLGYMLRLSVRRYKAAAIGIVAAVLLVALAVVLYVFDKQRSLVREQQLRREADTLRGQESEQRKQAERSLGLMMQESGRTELLHFGRPSRAAVLLSAAYQRGHAGAGLRAMLADAMRPVDALIARCRGHEGGVIAAAFAPDGKLLVTGGRDGTARIWKLPSCAPLASLKAGGPVLAVQIRPDGKQLATLSARTVELWEMAATGGGKALATLGGRERVAERIAYGPRGTWLATGANDAVCLWSVASLPASKPAPKHCLATKNNRQLSFSPDGQQLLTMPYGKEAELWDVASGKLLSKLEGSDSRLMSMLFSPDGTLVVAAGRDGTTDVWAVEDGTRLAAMKVDDEPVMNLMFSADGKRLAASSFDGTTRIWEPTTGQQLQPLSAHAPWARDGRSSRRHGMRIAVADGANVALWDVSDWRMAAVSDRIATFDGHQGPVRVVEFDHRGERLVSGADDGSAIVWDARRSKRAHLLQAHNALIRHLVFSPDGKRLASASRDRTVKLWRVADGALLHTLKGHSKEVRTIAFSPDGKRLVSAADDKTLRLWDAHFGKALATLEGHRRRVLTVAYSPDGKLILSGSEDGSAKLWEANSGRNLTTVKGHDAFIRKVVFNKASDRFATIGLDDVPRVWDNTGKLKLALEGHDGMVEAIAYGPDGKLLATGSRDSTVRIWNAWSGALQSTLTGHSGTVLGLAFSTDGKRLASCSQDMSVRLWQLQAAGEPKLLATLQGHTDSVRAVSFSPDGSRLLTRGGDRDPAVRIWDGSDGTLLAKLDGHVGSIMAARFSPGSDLVATAAAFSIRLWHASLERRSSSEVEAQVAARVGWQLQAGRLIPRN